MNWKARNIIFWIVLVFILAGLPALPSGTAAQPYQPGFEGLSSEQKLTGGEAFRQPEMANNAMAYTITDLGSWYPFNINNKRQIVGQGQGETAVLWQDGQLYNLGQFGGDRAEFRDINENNQITGYARLSGDETSFRWTDANQNRQIDDGELEWLGNLGGDWTIAEAINNNGHIVGTAQNNAGYARAFFWAGGAMIDLGDMGNKESFAYDINDLGTVVGHSCLYGACAVKWVNGSISVVEFGGDPTPDPGDEGSAGATAVNNLGQIVGYAMNCGCLPSYRTTFAWLPEAAFGLPAGLSNLYTAGGSGTSPLINNLGQILIRGAGDRENGLLYENGVWTEVKNLLPPNSGWTNIKATGFNDLGDVIGTGLYKGQLRAFLLSPLRWTLMFYLAADNNLAGSYPAIFQNLEAMAYLPGVRILVLWDSNGTSDSGYYEVQYDTRLGTYAAYTEGMNYWPQGELNTGAPFTLSDFIQWGVQRSPSEYYALILDDHGSGLGGLAWDDTSTSDFITLAELKLALSTAQGVTGRKIDVLYMAMCLMGMIEDAYQVRGLADYYVASQDIQTTYTRYLTGMNALMNPEEVSRLLAENYANEIVARPPDRARAYTISVADLSQLDPLVTATNELGQALSERMGDISATVTTIANLVQRYDNESPDGITTADTYIDLYDFADMVANNLGSEANIVAKAGAVKQAVQNYILYEAHASIKTKNVDNSHGVSIFFPATASSFYSSDNYDFAVGASWNTGGVSPAALSSTTTWGGFLVDYFQATQPGGPDDSSPPLPLPKDYDVFTIYLPLVIK